MKSYIRTVLLVAALVAAASCAKPLSSVPTHRTVVEGERVTLSFSALDGLRTTKLTGVSEANETNIARWAVFAFEDATGLVSYGTSSSSASINMTLIAEHDYTIYAVVNYPTSGIGALDPSAISTAADLTNKVSYLTDNTYNRLLMFGSTTLTPARLDYDPEDAPGSYTPESVTINVQRMVSRIDVVKVAVDFSAKPHLAAKTFTLKGLYLTNVYRTARYGSDYAFSELSATRTAWYNTGGWHRGESADAGIDALASNTGINVVIDGSTPYNVKNSFYAYPNATPIGSDMHAMGSWYRRCTRIIIEADMDGTVMYYQVNVPSMERNHIYSVSNIVIKGLGSKDPEVIDYYEDGESVSYSIETSDWDGDYSVTEES